jgi:hypothetical protein
LFVLITKLSYGKRKLAELKVLSESNRENNDENNNF